MRREGSVRVEPSPEPDRLEDDDVLRVSTSSLHAPSGFTLPGGGSMLYPGGRHEVRAMVADHERQHSDLNGHSAFGHLLARVGVYVTGTDKETSRRASARLAALVDLCRTTHEVYATGPALWHTMRSADEALQDYPRYQRYLEFGRTLCGDFKEGSMAAEYLVVTACWVAMQVPLHEELRTYDEDAFDFAAIPGILRLDVRLQALLDRRASLDFTWIPDAVPQGWLTGRAIDISRQGLSSADGSFVEQTTIFSVRLYLQYGQLLEELGMPVLEWDGHCKYDGARISGLVDPPLLLSQAIDGTPDYAAKAVRETLLAISPMSQLELHEQERLVRREPAGPLQVRPITAFPVKSGSDWALVDFIVDEPVPHILVVVRPVELVIEQYAPDERTAELLRGAARGGVLTAARVTTVLRSGELLTIMAPLTEHAHLGMFTQLPTEPERYPPNVVSNTSFSCMLVPAWSEYWVLPMQMLTSPVTLCDVLPSQWLTQLTESEENSGLSFAVIELHPPPGYDLVHVDALAAITIEMADAQGMMDRWTVLFGSPGTIGPLAASLAERQAVKVEKPDLLTSPTAVTSAVMARLAGEEPWFDREGLSYVHPGELTGSKVDRQVLSWCWVLTRSLRARQVAWRQERGTDTSA
jgi:hypothetical protein